MAGLASVIAFVATGTSGARAEDVEDFEPLAPAGEGETALDDETQPLETHPEKAQTNDSAAPAANEVAAERAPAAGPVTSAGSSEPLFPAAPDDACRVARSLLLKEGYRAAGEARAVFDRGDCHPEELRDGWHLLGRLCHGARDNAAALEALGRSLELNTNFGTAIADVLAFDLARVLADANNPEAAERSLALLPAVIADPHSALRAQAALLEVRLLSRAGRDAEARDAAKRLLERWPDAPFADEVRLQLGVTDPIEATLRDLPWSFDLHASTMRTRHLPSPIEDILLAAIGNPGGVLASPDGAVAARPRQPRVDFAVIDGLIRARRHAEARSLLDAWLPLVDSDDGDERRFGLDALERAMNVAWEEHRFGDVLAANARLRKEGRKKALSRYKEARALALDGDFDGGLKLVRKTGIRSELEDFLFEFGRCEEAVTLLHGKKAKRRGRRPAKGTDTDAAATKGAPRDERVALCLVHLGRGTEAAPFWAREGAGRGRGEALHARYWYARALQSAGQTTKARAVFERIVEDDPVDYYGHAAWSRLRDIDGDAPTSAPMPGAQVAWRGVDPSAYRPTIAWTSESLAGAFTKAPRPAPQAELETIADAMNNRWGRISRETARARAFIRLGLHDAAREELRVVEADIRASRKSSATLIGRARSDLLDNRSRPRARGGAPLREEGRWTTDRAASFRRDSAQIRSDIRNLQVALADPWAMRKSVFENNRIGRLDRLPPELAAKTYPLAYPDIVGPVSEQFGLPPYYVYAIMTTESAFHQGAVSVANAYGLVQVIPPTGRYFAREFGYFDFSPERLLDPATSVYFGSYYLARLLNRFRGQELLAAAGYNAGPHRVTTWLASRGHLPLDMFVELIPYTQARKYSKRIVEHVGSYRRTWHAEPHTYIRNGIVTELGDGPNY